METDQIADSDDITVNREDGASPTLAVTDRAKRAFLIDMWNQACEYAGTPGYFGKYNEQTGLFELNELTDITYKEALKIWERSGVRKIGSATGPYQYVFGHQPGGTYFNDYVDCRTYFPIISSQGYGAPNLEWAFKNNDKLETMSYIGGYGPNWYNGTFGSLVGTFYNCKSLRKIIGNLDDFRTVSKETFEGCVKLEYLHFVIGPVSLTLNLQWSPLIALESFQFMANSSRRDASSPAATIIVHPDIYEQIIDETNEDWHALLATADAKNIAFATV